MLENTYTTDAFVERLGLMRKYYGERLFSDKRVANVYDVLADECEPHTLRALEQWEARFKEQSIQPLVVYEALDAVQEDLAGMPSVTLYTPVHFPPTYVARFGQWFRDNIQPNMLITTRVDPRATGGCGIVWKNVYYDFSLHYFMREKRKEMVEMFNTHTHAA